MGWVDEDAAEKTDHAVFFFRRTDIGVFVKCQNANNVPLVRPQNKYDVPVFNVAYDGQGETNITTRLEAFMHQVKEYFKVSG